MKKEEVPLFLVNSALKAGATDVVAQVVDQNQAMIRFSNNEITVTKSNREIFCNIFLMIGKRRTSTVIPLSSSGDLSKAVRNLVETTRMAPQSEVYASFPKGPFIYDSNLLKGNIVATEPNELVSYVEDAISNALRAGAKKVAGTLIATNLENDLATSGQVHVSEDENGLEISVRAFVSDTASGHAVSISRDTKRFCPSEAGRASGEIAKASSNPVQGQPGKFMTLLGPMVFADLVCQIGTMASAALVDRGRSFLVDKIGSEVADENFTLIDDPSVIDSYGSKAFDGEGVPTMRNIIIDRGILKTYLHNSATAKKFDTKTTANAGLISPHPWNLIVQPGSKSFEELLSDIDEGVYVTNDWYLRYQNYRTGDFSTIPRDGMFLIKNGEISTPIRDLRISDNMVRLFQNIVELGKSRSWIKWWEVGVPTLTPYALIKNLNFTKSCM